MVCAVCNFLAPEYKIWVPVLFYRREKMYMKNNTKKITTTAMLAAIAYVVVVVGRIPVVLFLKYDPKDIIITLGGLIWGPLTSFTVSVIVSLIEMVTISENGILGCIMNIVSSCSFACTAAAIYKKKRTIERSRHRAAGRKRGDGAGDDAVELSDSPYLHGISP